jgi:hypothetical protein
MIPEFYLYRVSDLSALAGAFVVVGALVSHFSGVVGRWVHGWLIEK